MGRLRTRPQLRQGAERGDEQLLYTTSGGRVPHPSVLQVPRAQLPVAQLTP